MSKQPIFTEERRNKILALLKEENKVLVTDLCKAFSVSQATIRTDLNALERQGLLQRTHGGAMANAGASFERTSRQKQKLHSHEKMQIAKAAAELVHPGDTISLDTGTTTACMVPFLSKIPKLTVLTADIKIASLLEHYPDVTVIVAGGLLRSGFSCTTGAATNHMISTFNVDKAFMATNALSEEGILSTPYTEQAEVKRTLIATAAKKILLCDSSKLGQKSLVNFAKLNDFHFLLTDKSADPSFLSTISRSFRVTVKTI